MKDDDEGRTPTGASAQPPAAGATDEPERLNRLTPEPGHDDGEPQGLRPVSADMQQFIGRQLRAVFDDVAKQPVPDRFLELMRQLDTKTGAR